MQPLCLVVPFLHDAPASMWRHRILFRTTNQRMLCGRAGKWSIRHVWSDASNTSGHYSMTGMTKTAENVAHFLSFLRLSAVSSVAWNFCRLIRRRSFGWFSADWIRQLLCLSRATSSACLERLSGNSAQEWRQQNLMTSLPVMRMHHDLDILKQAARILQHLGT